MLSLIIYTLIVQDTQGVNTQVEAWSMTTWPVLQTEPRVGLTIYLSFRSTIRNEEIGQYSGVHGPFQLKQGDALNFTPW